MQRSPGIPLWLRLALVPLVAAIVIAGIWAAGGVVTNDFRLSMLLTALWVGVAGLAAVVLALRWRPLALPVLGTVVVTAGSVMGYLFYASSVDRVVDEKVAVAAPEPAPSETRGQAMSARPERNVALGAGAFESAAHETTGRATLIRLAEGGRVLTLTHFETDPGPDLRVYLVTGNADELGDVVDLGALKGNRGDQQYEVTGSVDPDRFRTVVIWCRAFSVAFGSARLA
jgi:Electron transfer DM13